MKFVEDEGIVKSIEPEGYLFVLCDDLGFNDNEGYGYMVKYPKGTFVEVGDTVRFVEAHAGNGEKDCYMLRRF